jgi:hypothetical protein
MAWRWRRCIPSLLSRWSVYGTVTMKPRPGTRTIEDVWPANLAWRSLAIKAVW